MEEMKTRVFIADVLPLCQPLQLEKYSGEISRERQAKVAGLKSINTKALSLGAEMLLQKALAEAFGIPGPVTLSKGDHGKPMLTDYPTIHFNLSHSGNFVVCGVGSHPIGVDIQKTDRVNLQLAKRFFAKEESAWLFSLPDQEQKKSFGDLWSIKESYMKYTGKGFGLPLNAFVVTIQGGFQEGLDVSIFENEQRQAVYVKKYRCPEHYVVWCTSGFDGFEEAIEWIVL